MSGLTNKRINDPLFEGWQTQYIDWPWYIHALLFFKRSKWTSDGYFKIKYKVLFGTWYMLGIAMEKPENRYK